MDTFSKIVAWLTDHEIEFRHVVHEPTPTSADSAQARGEELRVGGKAILLKVDNDFHVFVLPADRKLDSSSVKRFFKAKKLRFASADELHQQTSLVPGTVPPFGRPILPCELYVDEALTTNDRIAFNAGSLTDSLILRMQDYLRLAQPKIFCFSIPPT